MANSAFHPSKTRHYGHWPYPQKGAVNFIPWVKKHQIPERGTFLSSWLYNHPNALSQHCDLKKDHWNSEYLKSCPSQNKTLILDILDYCQFLSSSLEYEVYLLLWTWYFENFWYFTKFSFHHKWSEAWLLVINMVYMSCLTSCRTT